MAPPPTKPIPWWGDVDQVDPKNWGVELFNFNKNEEIHSRLYIYPLVNSHITMERSTIFHGKNHYK